MRIRQLTLTNVRQFEHRTFSFQPGFNLLVGENGTGKTTLLHSILAAVAGLEQTGRRFSLNGEDVRIGSSDLKIEAQITQENEKVVVFSRYRKRLDGRTNRTSSGPLPLVLFYGSKEATCPSFIGRKIRRFSILSKYKDFGTPSRLREQWLYEVEHEISLEDRKVQRFGKSRTVRKFVLKILSHFFPKLQDFRWSLEPYACSVRLTSPTENPPTLQWRRALANAIINHLQQRRRTQLGGIDRRTITINSKGQIVGEPHLKPVIPPFHDLFFEHKADPGAPVYFESLTAEVRLTPRIQIRSADGDFLLHQLSDGEQRLFSLFVDIGRQFILKQSTYEPSSQHKLISPDSGSAIILIDEIDAHLHPKWQRMIVPALEDLFPACQFIATTHSPFVVQAVREAGVQHLSRGLPGDFTDRGIEEIAFKVMDIPDHQVGHRYLEMLDTAREYFRLLEKAQKANARHRAEAKMKLDNLAQRYTRNPAYQAFLELHGHLVLNNEELR